MRPWSVTRTPSRRRIVMAKQTSKPMPQPTTDADEWLADFGAQIARAHAAITKIDRQKVPLDIQARSLDRALAKMYLGTSAPGSGRNSTRSA